MKSVLYLSLCTLAACAATETLLPDNETASPNENDQKVNLGWPKFFNPEKAILRKKEGAAKKKKATAEDKETILGGSKMAAADSSLELLEENRLVNLLKDKTEWEEDWTQDDYKIKDGLRGTLVMLSHNDSDVITQGSPLTEDDLAAIKDELQQEYDVYDVLSEVSDDGLRLAMPLFRQRYTQSLAKYGAEITYFDLDQPQSVLYFGNWCGRGGRIAPVGPVDLCCMEHAKCYGRQVYRCPDVWRKPYATMYAWTIVDGQHFCVRSESTCINMVCGCDIEVTRCMMAAMKNLDQQDTESMEDIIQDELENDEEPSDLL